MKIHCQKTIKNNIKKKNPSKQLMNRALNTKTGYTNTFHQKNNSKNLRGVTKYYTFASL